jgi:hypothetical protein
MSGVRQWTSAPCTRPIPRWSTVWLDRQPIKQWSVSGTPQTVITRHRKLGQDASAGSAVVPEVYDCDKSSGEKTPSTGTMGDEIIGFIGTGRVTLAELMAAGNC